MTELCGKTYVRVQGDEREYLKCQYIDGHPIDRHSWYAIAEQDIVDAEKRKVEEQRQKAEAGDGTVKEVLEQIEAGLWDSYIEVMLSALHDRKRALRNVRGFPNLERRGKRSA